MSAVTTPFAQLDRGVNPSFETLERILGDHDSVIQGLVVAGAINQLRLTNEENEILSMLAIAGAMRKIRQGLKGEAEEYRQILAALD